MPGPLGQSLQAVSRAISARTTLPILNNILIQATDQGLALTATNLEIGIRKVVPAEVSDEGATTVPARLITDFVSTLPDQELTLELDLQTQTLGLRCGRFDTHIKGIEAEECLPSPRPDEGDRRREAPSRRADPDGGLRRRGAAGPDRGALPGQGARSHAGRHGRPSACHPE